MSFINKLARIPPEPFSHCLPVTKAVDTKGVARRVGPTETRHIFGWPH